MLPQPMSQTPGQDETQDGEPGSREIEDDRQVGCEDRGGHVVEGVIVGKLCHKLVPLLREGIVCAVIQNQASLFESCQSTGGVFAQADGNKAVFEIFFGRQRRQGCQIGG